MRRFKGLSLMLTFFVISTILFPASVSMAAEEFSYEQEANKLNTLGLYKGISSSEFVPDLGSKLNRETGVVMLLRILGLEAEADSLSDKEVEEALAKFEDANEIAAWAKKQVAYAAANDIAVGTAMNTLDPKAALNGKAYCTLILRQLGYNPDYFNAAHELAKVGGLNQDEAVKFNTNQGITKDGLVGISFGALTATYKDSDKMLIDKLIEKDIVTEEKARAAGVIKKSSNDNAPPITNPGTSPSNNANTTRSSDTSHSNSNNSSETIANLFSAFTLTNVSNAKYTFSTNAIDIKVPKSVDRNALVSTFTLPQGCSAYIGNTLQISGETANNFANGSISYRIVCSNSTYANITVSVNYIETGVNGVSTVINTNGVKEVNQIDVASIANCYDLLTVSFDDSVLGTMVSKQIEINSSEYVEQIYRALTKTTDDLDNTDVLNNYDITTGSSIIIVTAKQTRADRDINLSITSNPQQGSSNQVITVSSVQTTAGQASKTVKFRITMGAAQSGQAVLTINNMPIYFDITAGNTPEDRNNIASQIAKYLKDHKDQIAGLEQYEILSHENDILFQSVGDVNLSNLTITIN